MKASQRANHISTLKSFAIRFDFPISPFEHPKIQMYFRAIQKLTSLKVTLHNIVDIPLWNMKLFADVIPCTNSPGVWRGRLMFLSPKGWMVVFKVKKYEKFKYASLTSLNNFPFKNNFKVGYRKNCSWIKILFCKSAQNTPKFILLHYYYIILSIPTWVQSD